MNMGTALHFHMPPGWTVRKVATALAREWLPAFRPETILKNARWVVQPVVGDPVTGGNPLWEPGISTEEFEERMERADLSWSVRASLGRGRATVLARLVPSPEHPTTFQMVCNEATLPESLFDASKLDELVTDQGTSRTQGLFTALLHNNGFHMAAI